MVSFTRTLLPAVSFVSLAAASFVETFFAVYHGNMTVGIQIGQPSHTYQFMVDTALSGTWLLAAQCGDNCPNTSGYERLNYSYTTSQTALDLRKPAEVTYNGGVMSGKVNMEDHKIYSVVRGTVRWEANLVAVDHAPDYANLATDGFLGLAINYPTLGNVTPTYSTMAANYSLDRPRFGIYFGINTESTYEGPLDTPLGTRGLGSLVIGESRELIYGTDLIHTVPVVQNAGRYDVWRLALKAVTATPAVANTKAAAPPAPPANTTAIFDTGVKAMALPLDMLKQVYQQIGWDYAAIANGTFAPLCSEFTDSWSVTIKVGPDAGVPLTVTGSQLHSSGYQDRPNACHPPFELSETADVVIGVNWLRNFYTVWDYTEDYQAPEMSFFGLKQQPVWT